MSGRVGGNSGQVRAPDAGGELDLAALGRALWARKLWIVGPTLLALVLSFVGVNMVTPLYRSEARILVESGENAFTRPEGDRNSASDRSQVDQEAVVSQVQMLLSRDVARAASGQLELARNPEFDPTVRGSNMVRQVLGLVGLAEDPFRMTAEERVLRAYFERLTAYQVDKSRVIAVQFESSDPQMAARAANTISDVFIQAQQNAKRNQSRQASSWLGGEVEAARRRVEEAEGRVESFRARASLFVGTNNTSLTAQQLADVNGQIASARAQQTDAQTRARLLRDFLRTGRPVESGDVVNSEIIRRLNEQRISIRAQLAELSSTLGPRHPRIGELRSQLVDLDAQTRVEAEKLVRVLENDARLAGARVEALSQNLDLAKRSAGQANEQEVQLRVLEREAKAQRDQLEALLVRYRDAQARETLQQVPADARIISRALVTNVPTFPKKLPTVMVATLGMMLLCVGCIATGALMSGAATRPIAEGFDPLAEPRLESPRLESPSLAPASMASDLSNSSGFAVPPAAPAPHPVQDHQAIRGIRELTSKREAVGLQAHRTIIVPVAGTGLIATGVTIALGRHLAARGRTVVMVDLAASEPALSTLAPPQSPGLTDLLAGSAGFARIIQKDPESSAHLVPLGRISVSDRALIADDRVGVALRALSQSYDVVLAVVDALPVDAERAGRLARLGGWSAVVSSNPASTETMSAYGALGDVGLGPVAVMLAEAPVAAEAA